MQKSTEPIEQIRARIRLQRQSVSSQSATAAATAACQQFLLLQEFSTAKYIAVYLAVNGEIGTRPLIEAAWRHNKQIYLPVLQEDGTLLFAAYTSRSVLRPNRYRIPEPEIDPNFPSLSAAHEMDVLIIPLVAFDNRCQRIGMGAGYYDRTLAGCGRAKPARIGLAYEFQQVTSIPARDWDVPMHKIVTESMVYIRKEETG
ncbi:MAG TPA: 5-formyltetrahydrofolate cyclo-ligase [Gammaproteobacteria bacterium]|nr:5-formyltetrahydrofolate cyclo-ligase [Gammaproteobacteria bacterium]